MIGTIMANVGLWLDNTFRSFDGAILGFFRNLHLNAGGFFDGFFKFISFLGDDGILFIIMAVIMLMFCKTRKTGLVVGLAILIGAIVTNLILKNVIERLRPYDSNSTYMQWFVDVFGKQLSDNSFPSGHATATFAMVTALFLTLNKKYSWSFYIFGILMACSRVYLVVHYPTDVIVGAVVGVISGIIAYYIVKAMSKSIGKRDNNLKEWYFNQDIITLVARLKKTKAESNSESKTGAEVDSESKTGTEVDSSQNWNGSRFGV